MAKTPSLDVRNYIEAFGGRQQVINRIRKRFAVKLSIKQVDKWVERGSIPGAHLVCLQVIGEETNPPITMLDFLTT